MTGTVLVAVVFADSKNTRQRFFCGLKNIRFKIYMDLSSDEEVLVLVAVAEDEDRNRSVESYFIKEKKNK